MPELINREWLVRLRPLTLSDHDAGETRTITAAYTTSDDDKPGWTLLKDATHKVVYQVRDDMVIDIRRADTATA